MAFEPNMGQANPQALFLARGSGYTTFLTRKEAVLVLRAAARPSAAKGVKPSRELLPPARNEKSAILAMGLVGANPADRLEALGRLPGKSNYLLGNVPSNWRTNIPNYRKVADRGVYPGIDLVYYGTQRELEYDFLIAPKAEPGRIRLEVRGARNLRVDADGDLIASIAGGEVQFHKPVAYQQIGARRMPVSAGYVLENSHELAFHVGRYDRSLPLVIDPTLAYSTYLGGSNIDVANAIAIASDGTAFIAGGTFSSDFPTAHPLQPNAGGPVDFPQDAFVAKLSADGSTLLYSTYLGGSKDDIANGVAVDFLGNAYVTGTTHSSDYPVTPLAFEVNCGGDGACGATWNPQGLIVSNGFVTKLNAAGSALIYSSYIGYYEDVSCQSIAVDGNGIAYIAGQTTDNIQPTVTINPPETPPPPFPITTTAFQQVYGGGATDAFVMTLSATGTSVLYSSYLGGSGEDVANGIAVDGNANAYLTGLTYSSAAFPLVNAVDPAYGGAGDAFFAKVNTNGAGAGSLVYSTYLGGSGLDQGNGIAVDSTGMAYVAGVTASTAPPFTTLNSYDGGGDAFAAKLDPSQSGSSSLIYFRYLGGSQADSANGIAVDGTGSAYITGSTVSPDFPIVAGAFQPNYGGGNADAFVTKLDPTGQNLVYSSFLGGTNTDIGNAIAVDSSGSAYVTGQTCSLDFPLANPMQVNSGGNCDAFISKVSTLAGVALNPAGLVFSAQSIGTTSQPQTVTLTNQGSQTLNIASIAIGGTDPQDFAETNTCGTSVAAGGQCTISVTFTPTATGLSKAEIDITDNAPGSPQVVSLSGSTSTLQLSASTLAFGNQEIGSTSAAQSVVATNQGTTAVTFTSITASGSFSETDNCTKAPLQPGTNCAISVTFTPLAVGSSVGALMLNDNAPGSPQEVQLTGTGVQPSTTTVLQISPASLNFGSQNVGTTSPSQAVSVTNQGTTSVTFASITVSGAFAETDNCTAAPLQPGAGCTINVTFTPVTAGSASGSLTLSDNVAGSPQVVPLTGTGATQQSDFTISAQPSSATISAGQTASYTLTLAPIGTFSQAVSLNCSGLPAEATCLASSNPVTVSAATNVTLQISTTARTLAPAGPWMRTGPPSVRRIVVCVWLGLLLLAVLLSTVLPGWRVRRAFSVLALAVTVTLLSTACNGGTRSGVVSGTPAGTYQVTVVGTSGSLSHSATVGLQVK
jgi:hypothetical protein